jgi:hypothetical protein
MFSNLIKNTMKKLLVLTVFALATLEVNAQKMTADKVPSAVKESFAKQYPFELASILNLFAPCGAASILKVLK